MKKRNQTLTPEERQRLLEQEHLIADATELICDLLERKGVNRQQLAERLGKSKGHITQLLSGERNMTLRTLADVAAALGHRFDLRTAALSAPRTYGGRREVPQFANPQLLHFEVGRTRPTERSRQSDPHEVGLRVLDLAKWGNAVRWVEAHQETGPMRAQLDTVLEGTRAALTRSVGRLVEEGRLIEEELDSALREPSAPVADTQEEHESSETDRVKRHEYALAA